MLKTQQILSLLQASAALNATKQPKNIALASQLHAIATAQTAQRAAITATKASKASAGKGGKGGPQRLTYSIACMPGAITHYKGAGATHAALCALLAKHGSRAAPKANTLASALAKNGTWQHLLNTVDGTMHITVQKINEDKQGTSNKKAS